MGTTVHQMKKTSAACQVMIFAMRNEIISLGYPSPRGVGMSGNR